MISNLTFFAALISGIVFWGYALKYMVDRAMFGSPRATMSGVSENKLLPHKIYYLALFFLVSLAIHSFIVYGFLRALVYVPFIVVAFTIGYAFQKDVNPDQIN